MNAQDKLITRCLKPEEITGDTKTKERRAKELVNWFVRCSEGNANQKWFEQHAYELAHYIAELKDM
jgi:hypothetical protein